MEYIIPCNCDGIPRLMSSFLNYDIFLPNTYHSFQYLNIENYDTDLIFLYVECSCLFYRLRLMKLTLGY